MPLADYLNQSATFSITSASSDALSGISGMLAPEPLKQWLGIITRAEKLNNSADETLAKKHLNHYIGAFKKI